MSDEILNELKKQTVILSEILKLSMKKVYLMGGSVYTDFIQNLEREFPNSRRKE